MKLKLYKLNSPPTILLGLIILGFLIRIIPYHAAIQNNFINFFEQDPYYHLRRVFLALSHHFYIPSYDSYSGFPQGLYCFWPSFYDLLIAIPAWLIGFGKPTRYIVELIAAFVPPILGALTLISVYLLTKEVFNKKIGLFTAFFYALLPGHIYWTLIGRPDHHSAEPIFPLLMFWFLLLSLKQQRSEASGQKLERTLPTVYSLRLPILTGVMLVCSLLVWPGALIFIGILVLYLLILISIAHGDKPKTIYLTKLNITIFGTAFLILLPICASTYWGKHFLFAYDALSWFHIVLICGILGILILLGYLSLWFSNQPRWRYVLSGLWFLIVLYIIIYLILPTFTSHFMNGIGWVIKSDPWLKTITEFQPLFISMGVFSAFRPTSFFGYGFYLLPLVYWILFYRLMKKRQLPGFGSDSPILQFSDSGILWFCIFFICIIILGLMQSRFSHFLAYLVAVGYAFLTLILTERFQDLFIKSEIRNTKSEIIRFLLTAVCLLVLLMPCLREIRSLPWKYAGVPKEWRETLLWIKQNTPATRYYDKPNKIPEYGILAPWIAGHWINYIAERPTICNGFHTNADNNRAGMRFFLTEDEMIATRILDEKKARYIILTDLTPNLLEYGKLIGTDASEYIYRMVQHPKEGGTRIAFLPTQQFYRLISSQLYLFDGMDKESRTALGNYRLVYETSAQWNVESEQVSCLKVFEKVKGASIIGHTTPKTIVRISVPIITNTGREFVYSVETIADYTGTYKFTVPYSTEDNPYPTKAKSSYSISWAKQKKSIVSDVNERQVTKGEVINLTKTN
ncbi:MAG: glycosyltransferase family 39 protein [bacterium]|nr:glycosyltransferase family 39 protein [bacterium]